MDYLLGEYMGVSGKKITKLTYYDKNEIKLKQMKNEWEEELFAK